MAERNEYWNWPLIEDRLETLSGCVGSIPLDPSQLLDKADHSELAEELESMAQWVRQQS